MRHEGYKMQISERLKQISPSMTLAINARAQEMRKQGIDVISLAVGEPDSPTPQFVKDAAIKAIEDNFSHYTPVAGAPELRDAAAKYFYKYYKTWIDPECVIIGSGGKQCLYNIIQTTINPGDEVLIPSPYWVSYPEMVKLAGGVPVFMPTTAETGFKINVDMIIKYTTPKTKMLILNSPCNPTGAVYGEIEFIDVMQWSIRQNIFVISDEIYDQLVYPPAKMHSAIRWFACNQGMVAVVNGLSKSYAMTGWRVGFLVANKEIIKKMTALQGQSTSNVCSIAQKAALAALNGPDDCVKELRASFEKRRDIAMDIVKTWDKAVCLRPDGTFYLFVDLKNYYNDEVPDSMKMASYILEQGHVAVVPGVAFGDDNCVRISFATSEENLKKALNKIGELLAALH